MRMTPYRRPVLRKAQIHGTAEGPTTRHEARKACGRQSRRPARNVSQQNACNPARRARHGRLPLPAAQAVPPFLTSPTEMRRQLGSDASFLGFWLISTGLQGKVLIQRIELGLVLGVDPFKIGLAFILGQRRPGLGA